MLGEIFFNIGLTFHQMGEDLESTKNFQWALKLSSNNKKISESKLIQQPNCDNNPKIPCNLAKPEKYKLRLNDVVTPQRHISQSGGGEWG